MELEPLRGRGLRSLCSASRKGIESILFCYLIFPGAEQCDRKAISLRSKGEGSLPCKEGGFHIPKVD